MTLQNKRSPFNVDQDAEVVELKSDLREALSALAYISLHICDDDGPPPPAIVARMAVERFKAATIPPALDEVNVKLRKWRDALESLTPGGSEFSDDPGRCQRFAKDRISNGHAMLMDALRKCRELEARQSTSGANLQALRRNRRGPAKVPTVCRCGVKCDSAREARDHCRKPRAKIPA